MKLLLEDFGGQDSFYELYSILFSEFAVYVLVFNMEWLLPGSPDMEEGLAYLRHWLCSVGTYCQTTSILMVGTRKDRVPLPRDHERISGLLYERFRGHPSWPSVSEWQDGQLSTGRGVLCFFPVDNTQGNRDPVVGALMRQLEARVRASEHLRHRVPFAWMALLDRMEALKRDGRLLLPRDEFLAHCADAGIPSAAGLSAAAEAGMALRFFNRLGLLMNHSAVPDLVILRPAEFLFPYFTRIICDFQVHSALIPEHDAARRRCPREFQQLQTKGLVSARLLGTLWEGREHHAAVQQLMVSLGLMVPLLPYEEWPPAGEDSGDGGADEEFLVPSVLPRRPASAPPARAGLAARVLFAVASAVRAWRRSGYVSLAAARREAEVPGGAFSRLVGGVASLCQQTEPFPSVLDMQIYRDSAAFELGRSRFELTNDGDCIGVYIDKGTGFAVSEMLQGQLKTIVDRYLPGFDFVIVVPSTGPGADAAGQDDAEYFAILSGDRGVKAREERKEAMKVGPRETLSAVELRERFRPWVVQRGLERDGYDVFLSYRWTPLDEELTLRLYSELGAQVLRGNEPPRTFLDKMRLEPGGNFVRDFAVALGRARIAVVVLSAAALERMGSSEACVDREDNVLLEWTLVLELLAAGRLRAAFPILIGEHSFGAPALAGAGNEEGPLMGTLFESRAYKRLSSAVHTRVNELAQHALQEMGVAPSSLLVSRSIAGVVQEMTKHLGIQAHEHFSGGGVGKGQGGGRQHGWEAGMRRLVQAVRRTLMGMLDSDSGLLLVGGDGGSCPAPGLTDAQSAPEPQGQEQARETSSDDALAKAAAASGDATGIVNVETDQSRAGAEMEHLRTQAAVADTRAAEAERLRVAEVEMARLRSQVAVAEARAAEAERLRAAEAEMERLRAQAAVAEARAAEAERLRAAEAEMERLRARLAEASRTGTQAQQSGCCCIS